jgi:hypothetical protein
MTSIGTALYAGEGREEGGEGRPRQLLQLRRRPVASTTIDDDEADGHDRDRFRPMTEIHDVVCHGDIITEISIHVQLEPHGEKDIVPALEDSRSKRRD